MTGGEGCAIINDKMHENCYVEGKSVAKCVRNPLEEFKGRNPRNSIKSAVGGQISSC